MGNILKLEEGTLLFDIVKTLTKDNNTKQKLQEINDHNNMVLLADSAAYVSDVIDLMDRDSVDSANIVLDPKYNITIVIERLLKLSVFDAFDLRLLNEIDLDTEKPLEIAIWRKVYD